MEKLTYQFVFPITAFMLKWDTQIYYICLFVWGFFGVFFGFFFFLLILFIFVKSFYSRMCILFD